MKRITSDLDTKNKLKILYYVIKAFLMLDIKELTLKKSNSKGYHLIIFTKKNYKVKDVYKLRKKINDDPHRVRMDKIRRRGKQTLFDNKIYFKNHKDLKKYLLTEKA